MGLFDFWVDWNKVYTLVLIVGVLVITAIILWKVLK